MHQIVRTSGNILYTIAPNCDSYPDFTATGLTQTIRVHKANQTGIPSSYTRKDSLNEPAAVVGSAAAIDGSDNIHIAWSARSSLSNTRYLRYAVFDTSTDTWGAVTTILSNLDYDDIGQGDENVAIAIDSNGKAHVVFLTTVGTGTLTNRRVYYTNNTTGSWAAATQVDSDITYTGNQKAWHPGIAFDANGRVVATFLRGTFNGTADGTIYIRTQETNGTWNSSVSVASSVETGIDESVTLLIDSNNRYHFGYSGGKNGSGWQAVLYSYSDNGGTSWTANNPSSLLTHNVTIGPNGSGGVRLWFHGTTSPVDVHYVDGPGGSGSWSADTIFIAGTYDSSVGTRWAQYHFTNPNYVDVAYWDEAYPNVLYTGTDLIVASASQSPSAPPSGANEAAILATQAEASSSPSFR
jgi:hypothetical protein